MSKRAIVFGVHPWGGAFRLGAHHLATALARSGYATLYVAAPLSPPHLAALLFSARARLRAREMLAPPQPPGVRVLVPFTWTPLSARWGADRASNLRHWPRTSRIITQIRELGFDKPDIAIIDGPLQLAAAQAIAPRNLVLRMFDRFSEMPGASAAFMALAGEAVRVADLTICTARALEADAQALGARRVVFAPNGVDGQHFQRPRLAPSAYAAIPAPRAVYVGQTGALFDTEVISACAAARPDISFVIIGPPTPKLSPLKTYANVHLLSAIGYDALPAYLQHADIGLAPFATTRFPAYIEAVNPLKIYEYLAAGLPIAATRWAELDQIGAPDLFTRAPEHFLAALDAARAAAPTNAEARRVFASDASWENRLASILAALN